MNGFFIIYIIGYVLKIEGFLMLAPVLCGIVYGEQEALGFFLCAAFTFLLGFVLSFKKPRNQVFYAKEGMIYGGCNCGNCHLTILPNGDLYACRRVQNSHVANVFTDRIADVWVGQMEMYRDYTKFEKCSKCELLAFCRGCPAVASGKDGNFYAADPQCWKEVV